jgi:hypothetical protein
MAKKKPKNTFHPPERGKVATHPERNASVGTETFRWTLDSVDRDGPYSILKCNVEHLLFILVSKLQSFGTMSWAEVEGKTGSHFVSVEAFSSNAQNRLSALNQEDIDSLFSLRITGKERLWGIRDRAMLKLIWWDPEHEVCPSTKKHT